MTTANIFGFTDVWNDSGTTFNAINVDVTDTASDAASKLINLEVGGTTQFSVQKNGAVVAQSNVTANGFVSSGNIDAQGNQLILDSDNDTYIVASTDDRLQIFVGGSEVARFDANATDTFQLDGVGFSPTGATLGQALGYPNSTDTLEPYTPAGAGDVLAAADEVITGAWVFSGLPNIAAMTALVKADLADGAVAIVAGYHSAEIGGGGRFRWDSDATTTANGVTVFASDEGGAGRWVRDMDGGPLDFRCFGGRPGLNLTQSEYEDNDAALDRVQATKISAWFDAMYGFWETGHQLNDGVRLYGPSAFQQGRPQWDYENANNGGLRYMGPVPSGAAAKFFIWNAESTPTNDPANDDPNVDFTDSSGGDSESCVFQGIVFDGGLADYGFGSVRGGPTSYVDRCAFVGSTKIACWINAAFAYKWGHNHIGHCGERGVVIGEDTFGWGQQAFQIEGSWQANRAGTIAIDVASLTSSGTTATVTLEEDVGLETGDWIKFEELTSAGNEEYNGWHKLTKVSGTVFTYTMSGTPGNATVDLSADSYMAWGAKYRFTAVRAELNDADGSETFGSGEADRRYLVGSSPTGAFSGASEGDIATYDRSASTWFFRTPEDGELLWIYDPENATRARAYASGSWSSSSLPLRFGCPLTDMQSGRGGDINLVDSENNLGFACIIGNGPSSGDKKFRLGYAERNGAGPLYLSTTGQQAAHAIDFGYLQAGRGDAGEAPDNDDYLPLEAQDVSIWNVEALSATEWDTWYDNLVDDPDDGATEDESMPVFKIGLSGISGEKINIWSNTGRYLFDDLTAIGDLNIESRAPENYKAPGETTLHVNASTGNDNFTGFASGAALATPEGVRKRLLNNPDVTTITLAGSLSNSTWNFAGLPQEELLINGSGTLANTSGNYTTLKGAGCYVVVNGPSLQAISAEAGINLNLTGNINSSHSGGAAAWALRFIDGSTVTHAPGTIDANGARLYRGESNAKLFSNDTTANSTTSAGGGASMINGAEIHTALKMGSTNAAHLHPDNVNVGSSFDGKIFFADTVFDLATGYIAPFILAQSGEEQTHTGNTNETNLAQATVPANVLGANGKLRISALYGRAGSAGNAITRLRFGNMQLAAQNITTTDDTAYYSIEVWNANATGAQVAPAINGATGVGGAAVTGTNDTTTDIDVNFNCQLANAADTIKLLGYTVEVVPGV